MYNNSFLVLISLFTNVIATVKLIYIFDNSDCCKCSRFIEFLIAYIMLKNNRQITFNIQLSAY